MVPRTLTEIVFRSFERFNRLEHFGFKEGGAWRQLSTHDARARVRAIAGSLAGAGIDAGDRIAILSPTRLEWSLVDYAAGSVRAVVVPIYPSLTAAQTAYVLGHARARIAFVDGGDTWRKVESVRSQLPMLREVVSFDPVADAGRPRTLAEFLERAGPYPADGPRADDAASIIYTSGTTGPPKGVVLTHANITANVLACTEACPFTPSDVCLSFLPLSHIFERMVNYYMLWNGLTIYYAEDLAHIKENLAEVRPTVLTSVPRLLEKVMAAVEEQGRGAGLKPRIARFGVDVARRWARAAATPHGAPLGLTIEHLVADALMLRKVRRAMGGRLRAVITGGAATPLAVTEFFQGAGVPVLPGYGLTECSPVIAFNTPASHRFGTVGRPIPGLEVRIAPDAEILVRGHSVMREYDQDAQATAAAIDRDGWLHTGDIGALDGDGFLSVTDRKKDLIATAGGKKVAPQPIEEALMRQRFITQAVLVGEGRPFIAVLLVPNLAALAEWARSRGLDASDGGALLGRAEVRELYSSCIAEACADRARFESVKRFAFLERELSEAEGELTPTQKVKRRVVAERYAALIDGLYANAGVALEG